MTTIVIPVTKFSKTLNLVYSDRSKNITFQLFIFSCLLSDSEGILILAGTIYIKNKYILYFIQSQLCRTYCVILCFVL